MKIAVTGGRDFSDKNHVYFVLDELHAKFGITKLIQGGANGADALAKSWAESRRVFCVTVLADWKQYGLKAGPIRNKQMLTDHEPDRLVAFPGGKGTMNAKMQARNIGVPIIESKDIQSICV